MITSKIETITPAIAATLLKKNPKNRKLRERHVKRLAHAMTKGQWQINNDAVCIAKNNALLNGQHRLAAVVISKVSVPMSVMRNMSEESITTMDTGATRNCGDHLKMQGYKGAVYALAAAVGVCLQFKKGNYTDQKERMSPDDMLLFIENNKGILKSLQLLEPDKELQDILPQSVSVALHYLFGQVNREQRNLFFHELSSGANLGKTSPVLKLRNELIALRKEGKRGEYNRRVYLWYTIEAFKAYIANKRIESLEQYKPTNKVQLPK